MSSELGGSALRAAVLILGLMIFLLTFQYDLARCWDGVFKKELHQNGEAVQAIVSANLNRHLALSPQYPNSAFDAVTQPRFEKPVSHVRPPLFHYLPLGLFKLDGRVTIETYRLTYGLVIFLAGLLFIIGIHHVFKSGYLTFSAVLAAVFWLRSPLASDLITGVSGGRPDILMALYQTACYLGLLRYLNGAYGGGPKTGPFMLVLISILTAVPVASESLPGVLPAVAFFVSLAFCKRHKFAEKALCLSVFVLGVLLIYFGGRYVFPDLPPGGVEALENAATGGQPWHAYWYLYAGKYFGRFDLVFWIFLAAGLIGGALRIYPLRVALILFSGLLSLSEPSWPGPWRR